MEQTRDYVYACQYMNVSDEIDWASLQGVPLKETATGEAAAEDVATVVRACWCSRYLHIRFECVDEYVKSEYTRRDDPLYEADVVEVFIDEEGDGRKYLEIEVSPHNVVFDAIVWNDLNGNRTLDMDWNAYDMRTRVSKHTDVDSQRLIYELAIPFGEFDKKPDPGDEWRVNFYRIDEDVYGARTYLAWSPTRAIDYHRPQFFGTLVFERD